MIQGYDWVMGKEFTVVDGYALVFYGWGARSGFPMKELSAYTAWQERVRSAWRLRRVSRASRPFQHKWCDIICSCR